MSEEIIKSGDNNKPEPEKPKDIVMTITLTQAGQLSVQAPGNGAMYDLPVAFYLLELAKDHVKATNKAQSQARIVQAKPRIGDIFRRHH